MGLFDKLKAGLQKTRAAVSEQVESIIKTFTPLDENFFDDLEEALIMADLGAVTAMNITEELRTRAKEKKLRDGEELKEEFYQIVCEILTRKSSELTLNTKPSVVLVIGVNGVGKTTSIGKLAHVFKSQGKKVLLAAGDTFRAAAADQLGIWAERAGVDLIRHGEGADPAAVVFDAMNAAKARGCDIVLCDTAGRLHNKQNLMNELQKISRVIDRELPGADVETLLVLDATTGQNAVSQAKEFTKAAGVSGIVLTKLDGTAKGGIVVSIADTMDIPVKFIGVGEQMDDLMPFDAESFAKALF
ncbi:MAG: signal recognition particle-docking protein FtsY [Oscillospiraceae bacterium]|nr:signal recognition particle-docking protein FtsY [Oscillospiraceae bacterium]